VPPAATLLIAHTAPGVPPFRLCFSFGSAGTTPTVPPIPALPDSPAAAPPYPTTGPYPAVAAGTPGIYPGTIGAFPGLGLSYQDLETTFYAVFSSSVANDLNFDAGSGYNAADGGAEEDCVQLIGTHGLGVGPDPASGSLNGRFVPLPTVPAGTFDDNQTYLVSLNGCLPDGTASPGAATAGYTCGANYDKITAALSVVQLDTTTIAGSSDIGVQFVDRSLPIQNTPAPCFDCAGEIAHTAATDGVLPAFFRGVTDGGIVPIPVSTSPVTYDSTGAPTPTQRLVINASDPTMQFGASVVPLDGGSPNTAAWPGFPGAPGDVIALPLTTIALLSSWTATTVSPPNGFANGQTYTFLLTGDPYAQPLLFPDGGTNPLYDGRGVHLLAFPNSSIPISAP
jgi:hypothetical protein